jgi:hypothetical protein
MIEYGINLMVQSTILFTKEGNYGCILNVDWFQPYKHAHYMEVLIELHGLVGIMKVIWKSAT